MLSNLAYLWTFFCQSDRVKKEHASAAATLNSSLFFSPPQSILQMMVPKLSAVPDSFGAH